jgi:hypothetical protein
MTDAHDRLKEARRMAGFPTPTNAARAMGVGASTYLSHENKSRGVRLPALARYAKFYRVNLDWLVTGKGAARGPSPLRRVMLHGFVRGGAQIEEVAPESFMTQPDFIELWQEGRIGALEVEGDSMWPRFMAGEYILFELTPRRPAELLGEYAIVQTLDGRRMIKILQAGRSEGRFRLESHKAAPIEDIELLAAWRYCGCVPPAALSAPLDEEASTSARSIASRKKAT